MCDYLINGLSLNKSIKIIILNNCNFNKKSLHSWSLCFAANTTIESFESNSYVFNI